MLEVLLLLVVLAPLFASRLFRDWFRTTRGGDLKIAASILALFLAFHFLDFSRATFPFVRWAMYSDIYEPEEMKWGLVRATLQDGSTVDINTATEFPSLSRNFHERFEKFVEAKQAGELTELGEEIFERVLTSIGEKYNDRNRDNPAIEMSAFLSDVDWRSGKTRTKQKLIASYSLH